MSGEALMQLENNSCMVLKLRLVCYVKFIKKADFFFLLVKATC